MRVLACGSRAWTNYESIARVLAQFPRETVFMHGGATGADSQVARYIREANLPCEVYLPAYGAVQDYSAPIMRNLFMLELQPDRVVAFWDGRSPGTGFVLREARRRGIPTETWRT